VILILVKREKDKKIYDGRKYIKISVCICVISNMVGFILFEMG
jgi:hypothetical protein